VIVPPGANSHTYEPTPRQVLSAQKGAIWFRLGESFETRMIPVLQQKTVIVDQREGIDLIEVGCGCCLAQGCDPHIWLSPRLLKKQASQIVQTLTLYCPEYAPLFQRNFEILLAECEELDQECTLLCALLPHRLIVVSHPAFGYFCRDYGLEQLSIEMEGREPTPRYLTELINKARTQHAKTVFLQIQHNPKGGKRIAQELGAEIVYVDPYVENVIDNLRTIAKLFAHACN
jgi:zinc transport system substrate-binding protein